MNRFKIVDDRIEDMGVKMRLTDVERVLNFMCDKLTRIEATEQPRKTVEDAVNKLGSIPIPDSVTHIGIAKVSQTGWLEEGDFEFVGQDCDKTIFDLICTIEQFEACVAAKSELDYPPLTQSLLDEAESEPEWTHEVHGVRCNVLNDEKDSLGNIVVALEGSGYATPRADSVKPIKPTISKTVEDAVEWNNGEWLAAEHDLIAFNPKSKIFQYGKSIHGVNEYWQLVCTREQFEAYVKEQAGEKWTHTHDFLSGEKVRCIVVAEHNKYSWLLTEGGGMVTEYTESLKPIKPTITKADEAALVEFMKSSHKLEVINEVRSYIREHNIT